MEIIANKEVIDVNQGNQKPQNLSFPTLCWPSLFIVVVPFFADKLGVQGKKVRMEGDLEVHPCLQ